MASISAMNFSFTRFSRTRATSTLDRPVYFAIFTMCSVVGTIEPERSFERMTP